nr:immunoglobulin heavy chain junction region [Mus musculus]MBK4188368.1 immunoglobulin heavy chain junction region [Mus musculus]MBK4188369.1 immunoglobulin heavy chain junction region [Mus musculus]MBK4188370.1 immunoglobulin heavy chain junction region [Mus musculus]MBK4188371.1 immunoglobulin heavy chain junction region [Mus musculus]
CARVLYDYDGTLHYFDYW